MVFNGSAEGTIDQKLRLAVPAKFRAKLGTENAGQVWVCVPWPTKVLRVYPQARFQEISGWDNGSLMPDEDEADLESDLFSLAETVEMDSAGRIAINKLHLELTGIGTEVVVNGVKDHLEVRDRAAWKAALETRFQNLPNLVRKVRERRVAAGLKPSPTGGPIGGSSGGPAGSKRDADQDATDE
ncbi:MAG: hypothetical protein SFZ23_06775 [Planctomycetota bacterium]|nr:hypothetical protein [Planctomycetota bacterium]